MWTPFWQYSDSCYNLNLDVDAERIFNTIKLIVMYTQYLDIVYIHCEVVAKAVAMAVYN